MRLRLPGRGCEPITLWGNDVLRQRATAVTVFDREVAKLVDQLFDTMYAIDVGVGLAANQIGRTDRVFVFDCRDDAPGYLINPEIELLDGESQVGPEGCLSLPGEELITTRSLRCVVRGQDVKGNDVRFDGEGLRARCFQHEVDHLNGELYIDHHPDAVRVELEKHMSQQPWFGHDALDPRSSTYRRAQRAGG